MVASNRAAHYFDDDNNDIDAHAREPGVAPAERREAQRARDEPGRVSSTC